MAVNDSHIRFGFVIPAILLVVGIVPTALHNLYGLSPQLTNNQRDIHKLSEAEKLQLQQNYLRYQRLSQADRQSYKQLVDQLQADQREQGDLNQVATRYRTWLQTLTIKQLEDLRALKTPKQRIARIEQLHQEQQAGPDGSQDSPNSYRNGMPLQREILESMAQVVEPELKLSPAQRQQLNALAANDRYIFLLSNMLKKYQSKPNQRQVRWLSPRLAALMVDQIPHLSTRQRLQQLESSRQVSIIETQLTTALYRELERHLRPKRDVFGANGKLDRVRERLTTDQLKRISQLPQQDRFRATARELALASYAEELGINLDDLRRLVDWVREKANFNRSRSPSDRKSYSPFRPKGLRHNTRPQRN